MSSLRSLYETPNSPLCITVFQKENQALLVFLYIRFYQILRYVTNHVITYMHISIDLRSGGVLDFDLEEEIHSSD